MWATKKNPKMEETRKHKTATLEAYFVPWALTADSIYVFSLWHTVTLKMKSLILENVVQSKRFTSLVQ